MGAALGRAGTRVRGGALFAVAMTAGVGTAVLAAGAPSARADAPAAFATLAAAASTEALAGLAQRDWQGELKHERLGDGSVLNEYVAYTESRDTAATTLRVAFVPRFGCAVLLGIRFGGEMTSSVEALLDDGDEVTLRVDGEAIAWPVLVDANGVATTLWFDGALDRRTLARRRIEAGQRARLTLPSAVSVDFSLLGSRLSIERAEVACRVHEPTAWVPD